jgi:hypothetical protein
MNSVKAYKPPVSGMAGLILKLLANISGIFVNKITHSPSKIMVQGFVTAFQNLITALSDANPNDSEQIQAVIHKFLTEGSFYDGSRQTILANINKIENEDVRIILTVAMGIVYRMGDVLTDEHDNNQQQLKEMLSVFLKGEDGVLLVTSLLTLMMPKETAAIISLLIIEAIRGVLSEDQEAMYLELEARLKGIVQAA